MRALMRCSVGTSDAETGEKKNDSSSAPFCFFPLQAAAPDQTRGVLNSHTLRHSSGTLRTKHTQKGESKDECRRTLKVEDSGSFSHFHA